MKYLLNTKNGCPLFDEEEFVVQSFIQYILYILYRV